MLDEHALPISEWPGSVRGKGWRHSVCECRKGGGEGCKDLSKLRRRRKKGLEGWLGRYNEFFSNSIIVARSNYSRRSEE